MRGRRDAAAPAGGFGYLGLLIGVAMLAMVAAAGLQLGAVSQRRGAEQALLETGAAFSQALRSYARATPRGQPDAPPSLQALLKDPRLPGAVRHLRKLPFDPLTGSSVWGLLRDGDGDNAGIVAVYSLAGGKPIKIGLFDARFADFEGKLAYSDWKFARPAEAAKHPWGLAKGLISPADLLGGGGGGGGGGGSGSGSGARQPPGADNGPGINARLVSPTGPR